MKKSTATISTLIAASGTLATLPVAALELGEIKVNSTLGQPLRASIAYALAPNEALSNTCVSVAGGRSLGARPSVSPATISIANGVISIVGKTAVREPLVSMRLNVHCPYAASISREYTMFIDPAGLAEQVNYAPAAPATVATPTRARTPAIAPSRTVRAEPVATGTQYQVVAGETIGDIAQRIVNRPVGLWAAVDRIVAANPDAFIDGDPNQLKAGSLLTIPNLGTTAPVVIAATVETAPAATQGSVYTGMTEAQSAVPLESVAEEFEPISLPEPGLSAPVDVETPQAVEVIDIPNTALPAPETTSTSPNVASATIRPTLQEAPKTNWFAWLVGAGLGLIALMLFFGRQVRKRFSSSPIGAVAPRERRQPESSRTLEVVSEMEVTIDDLDETQENLALDADLIIGSGLQESNEIDVAQDFGFAATTHLDHDFSQDLAAADPAADRKKAETDIIPPLNIEVQSILESEVLPDEEEVDAEDDYDMSVIIDATKMPDPEDVTLRDLEAIPVETVDDTLVTGDYTVSSEVDYTVLEQDYEDELTATQALNEEIARAAEELADDLGKNGGDISMASVAALDITAQLPANNDDNIGDDDIDEDATEKLQTKRGA